MGAAPPVWSPDGARIAFTSGSQIYTISSDGTDVRQVTEFGGVSPSRSPLPPESS